jgi:8-oxo-dGTP pyrophosphatase MutT (NUDIX family)
MIEAREALVVPNVCGLVRRRGAGPAVLIQKRWKPHSDPDNLGRWELPGGKWRALEPAMDCLRREVEEETGIRDVAVGQATSRHELRGEIVQVSRPDLRRPPGGVRPRPSVTPRTTRWPWWKGSREG